MGMDLLGAKRELYVSYPNWATALVLALDFGWQPAGTQPPGDWDEKEEWNGHYCGNGSQRVLAEDAKGLATALRLAVTTMCAEDIFCPRCHFRLTSPAIQHFASTKQAAFLVQLIEFLEKGGFVIT